MPPNDSFRDGLLNAIDGIQKDSKFASFYSIPNFVDPQLTVDPCGPITFPSKDVDASRIIAASHQAPYGTGAETIINTERFAVRLRGLGMGTNSEGVRAELYKLLLYEKGAHFKAHTDSQHEKTPGMFGTMIICLPSQHEGGKIELSHTGQKKFFSSAQHHASFGVWYTDVRHQIKEVTSGHRLVLTYNLVKDDSNSFQGSPAVETSEAYNSLFSALKKWSNSTDPAANEELIYMLEHQYTDASLKLANLKDADLARAKALLHFAAKFEFTLCLATMDATVHGGYEEDEEEDAFEERWDDEDEDDSCYEDEPQQPYRDYHFIDCELDRDIKLNRVVDLNGRLLCEQIDVDEESILQPSPLDEREPDEEEYEGFTENEGASATHWYRDTVFVLVPASSGLATIMPRSTRPSQDSATHTNVLTSIEPNRQVAHAAGHKRKASSNNLEDAGNARKRTEIINLCSDSE